MLFESLGRSPSSTDTLSTDIVDLQLHGRLKELGDVKNSLRRDCSILSLDLRTGILSCPTRSRIEIRLYRFAA